MQCVEFIDLLGQEISTLHSMRQQVADALNARDVARVREQVKVSQSCSFAMRVLISLVLPGCGSQSGSGRVPPDCSGGGCYRSRSCCSCSNSCVEQYLGITGTGTCGTSAADATKRCRICGKCAIGNCRGGAVVGDGAGAAARAQVCANIRYLLALCSCFDIPALHCFSSKNSKASAQPPQRLLPQ